MLHNTFFQCHDCGRVYEKLRPEAVAIAEFNKAYPGKDIAKAYTVCRRCYEVAMRILRAQAEKENWNSYRQNE